MQVRDSLPLWRVISDTLVERLDRGVYDHEFPGELELAKEFGVSRGTIRHALTPLRERGRITATRGRKPRIAQRAPHSSYGAIYSLRELITDTGARHESRVLDQRIVCDQAVGATYNAPAAQEFFRLERVRYADGEPIAHDVIYSPAEVSGALIETNFADTAFYEALRTHTGYTIERGHEDVSAVAAPETIARHLHCDTGEPLLLLTRMSEAAGRTVELRYTHVRSDRFTPSRSFGTLSL